MKLCILCGTEKDAHKAKLPYIESISQLDEMLAAEGYSRIELEAGPLYKITKPSEAEVGIYCSPETAHKMFFHLWALGPWYDRLRIGEFKPGQRIIYSFQNYDENAGCVTSPRCCHIDLGRHTATGVEAAPEVNKTFEFTLIRHGDPDYDNDCLTENGRIQAELAAQALSKYRPDYIYSSPMGRAQATAKPLAELLNKEVTIEPWAPEWYMGQAHLPPIILLNRECLELGNLWYTHPSIGDLPMEEIRHKIYYGMG